MKKLINHIILEGTVDGITLPEPSERWKRIKLRFSLQGCYPTFITIIPMVSHWMNIDSYYQLGKLIRVIGRLWFIDGEAYIYGDSFDSLE